jgi:hypothetical protein
VQSLLARLLGAGGGHLRHRHLRQVDEGLQLPVLLRNGRHHGPRQQVVRRHGHREEHPRHALQRGRYRLGPGQVPDDDLGAEPIQLRRPLVRATDHESHRHVPRTQLLEDHTAHAAGTGDKNKVVGNHQSPSEQSIIC